MVLLLSEEEEEEEGEEEKDVVGFKLFFLLSRLKESFNEGKSLSQKLSSMKTLLLLFKH